MERASGLLTIKKILNRIGNFDAQFPKVRLVDKPVAMTIRGGYLAWLDGETDKLVAGELRHGKACCAVSHLHLIFKMRVKIIFWESI